jgi:light-regulated signal transduction histidine kinase (bacteriophytochrome)
MERLSGQRGIMKADDLNRIGIWKKMILMAVALGTLYWVLASVIDVFVFHDGTFVEETFTLNTHKVWMRSLVLGILIMFSFYAQGVIAERKRAEATLLRQARQLERANEELERKNAELDQFTYVASHDLQEPLRKVTAFSGILRRDLGDNLPERAEKDLGFIVDAAKRMQKLVQDLLALSRSGRVAMQVESISLDRCADRAIDSLAIRIKESQGEIIRDELPQVWGDRTMLTQLYQNLLANALKFAAADRPQIRLTAERRDEQLILGVKDNGIGIEPKYAEQIFAPFKRLHGRGKYEGTGIGLAICSKTVERHGGKIWVESTPGRGAHFKFTLDEVRTKQEEENSWSSSMESLQSSCSPKMTPAIKS